MKVLSKAILPALIASALAGNAWAQSRMFNTYTIEEIESENKIHWIDAMPAPIGNRNSAAASK